MYTHVKYMGHKISLKYKVGLFVLFYKTGVDRFTTNYTELRIFKITSNNISISNKRENYIIYDSK